MSEHGQVMLVDDEPAMRASMAQWLELAGYEVEAVSAPEQVLAALDPAYPGILISDVKMPRMDGMELLARIAGIDSDLPVVLVTGHGDIAMAVEAMRRGAYDFLEKPFEPDRLLEIVRRASEKRRLVLENRALRRKLAGPPGVAQRILGNAAPVRRLREEIEQIAGTDASVLVLGETGTGKEVVARCLHDFGARARGHFVAVNCAAIPETIFESELFGHEAGAFTGAAKRRVGKLEHASGGTLFLDEISSMPLLQVKLLRALQEREIERIGSNETIAVDVRVIAASNVDLKAAVEAGDFRADLYFRLNVVELTVPPLRRRDGDVAMLFEYFVAQAGETHGRDVPPVTPEGLAALAAHDWPGNVRELKNMAERFVLSSLPLGARIQSMLGQVQGTLPEGDGGETDSLAERALRFERQVLDSTLRRHEGNIQAVMAELDLPRRTLNQKMLNHGLERKDYVTH